MEYNNESTISAVSQSVSHLPSCVRRKTTLVFHFCLVLDSFNMSIKNYKGKFRYFKEINANNYKFQRIFSKDLWGIFIQSTDVCIWYNSERKHLLVILLLIWQVFKLLYKCVPSLSSPLNFAAPMNLHSILFSFHYGQSFWEVPPSVMATNTND